MEKLYRLRLEIDGLIQLIPIGFLEAQPISRSLFLSKSWMTKIIRILNPEENSLDTLDINEIKNRHDIMEYQLFFIDVYENWKYKSNLEKIDLLITEIDKIINQLPNYVNWYINIKQSEDYINTFCKPELPNWKIEIDQVYINLTEAKMFLGFELLNLK